MSFFDDFSKKATDAAKYATKKTGDIIEQSKLNITIGALEGDIKDIYVSLGKAIYDQYINGDEISDDLIEYCKEIDDKVEEIRENREKINEIKKVVQCSNCKAENAETFEYCPYCGHKQD